MFTQFLKYGTTFCAIEHTFNADNTPVFNLLTLQKKKKELQVKDSKQFINLDTLFSFTSLPKHVFLIVNNEQILSKKSTLYDDDATKVVQNTFQNINLNDFYYQVDSESTNSTICRKNYIDAIIQNYKENNIAVIGFSIGNSSVKTITPYINTSIFHTSNAKITLEENKIISVEKEFEDANYIVNDLEVSNHDLISLGGILNGYFENNSVQIGLQEKITELKKSFLDARIFKLGLNFSLGSLLIILLINFLVFSSYSTKVNSLNTALATYETQKLQVNNLKNKVIVKEALINDLNKVLQSEITKYIDEIAASVPENILLQELSYQPLQSTIRFDKEILFNKKNILVKGVTKKDAEFSNWTEVLSKNKWVQEIIFQGFNNTKNGNSNFEFLIKIRND